MTPGPYCPLIYGASRSATRARRAAISVTPVAVDCLPPRVTATWAEVNGGDVPERAVAVVGARADRPARHPRDGVVDSGPCVLALVVGHRDHAKDGR